MSGYVTGVMGTVPAPLNIVTNPVTGIVGMWDASNFSSLNLSGTNVISVADGSGGGNTMQKVGSVNFPQYSATGFNSRPAVIVTATDLCALEAASFPMGTGTTLTFWYVGTNIGPSSQAFARPFSYATPTVHDDWNFAGSWSVNNVSPIDPTICNFQRNSINIQVTGISAPPSPHRIIGTIDAVGTMILYIDNVASASASSPGNWVTGGTIGWGRNGFGDFNRSTITCGEFGIATSFSNPTTVAQLDNFLKNKWGL